MLLKLLLSSKPEKFFLANNYHSLVNTKKKVYQPRQYLIKDVIFK